VPGLIRGAEPERYNLISIVIDDQARWAVGAYGNPEVRTPHIDRLADEGAKFLNAFVPTPVCSPSWVSFLTGLYGTQVGITDFLCRQEEAAGLGLPDSAVTWPAVLQRYGYATALVGKWHLGTRPQFHPTRHGFDHFFGWLLTPQSIDPILEVDGEDRQLRGSLPDLMVDEALRCVEVHRGRPFALLVHFLAPHHP
jgi:arylsulfatase A-like enzyme